MKRNIIVFVFVSLGILLSLVLVSNILSVNSKKLTTDSGFDSSWDSGGSSWDSGGSSWDSDSSSDYGGGSYNGSLSSDSLGVIFEVFVFIILALMVFLIFLVLADNTRTFKKTVDNYLSDKYEEVDERYISDAIYSEITFYLSKHNLNKLGALGCVFDLVKKVLDSYSIGNMNTVSDIISPAVKSSFIKKIVENNSKNIKETYSNYRYKNGFIFDAKDYNENSLLIKMEFMFSCFVKENDKEEVSKDFCYLVDTLYENNSYKIISLKESKGTYYYTDKTSNKSFINSFVDSGLDKEEVLRNAYNIYVRVQEAWMNDTLDDVKDVISDEIYNQYSGQLATMRVKDQQNVMGDFRYVDGFITDYRNNGSSNRITVEMCVTCKDYLVKKSSGKVLRGSSFKTNRYRYLLTFVVSNNVVDKCPNCGASLDTSKPSEVCEFCESKIVKIPDKMVLTDKKMISQS